MPNFDIIRESKPKKSFRVESVKGQFDLQIEHIKEHFIGSLPIEDKSWNIGIIYGASGTGKSTIAKELFPDEYIREFDYNADNILDDMPKDKTTEEITKIFNSVGFATVWSWLKPYSVLSTGEKMRVDLARSILENRDLIVFDEFTSVVNREVAKAGSFAISKAVRKLNKKFIAVTCHKDILEWLEPDWTFNTDAMTFEWSLLRRPEIKLDIYEVTRDHWKLFKKYHYLSTELNPSSKCYVGAFQNEPVVFFSVIHFPHPSTKMFKRGHRLVVLPDYQGLGIGHEFSSEIAKIYKRQGYRFIITSSTKSLFRQRAGDKNWAVTNKHRNVKHSGVGYNGGKGSENKITYSYEYIGN